MDMSVALLASFLPGPLVRTLSARSSLPERLTWETCRAATMQMDVSGFSPLTQRLAVEGALGTEEIVAMLDRYFDALIDTVDRHGGLMVGFGGDSLVAAWFVDETTSEGAAAQLAAACALEAQHTIARLSSGEGEALGFRIGIGFGDAVLLDLGGLDGRWIFAMCGPALSDMGIAVVETDPGGVAVSGAIADLMAEKARFGPMRNGNFELLEVDPAEQEAGRQFARPTLVAEVAPVVEAYLPAGLLERLRIGEPRWMAEHRTTTNLFLNLPGLDVTEDRGRNALQLVVRTAQEAFDRYEGVLAAVVADDKGTTILGMFGLPPVSREEDSIRAIATGQALSRALLDLHIDHGVGIATGRSYCGIYGNDVFRTYAVVGPGVNLAARLMQAANNEVVCDQATVRATRGRVHFSALPPVRVKGIADPIQVHRPIWAEQALRSGSSREKRSRPILGREGEQALIADRLRSAAASRTSARIVLQGEAGIGKTVLALDAVRTATSLGFRCLVGGADPVETAPYHAWRAIGRQALGFDSIVDATDQRVRLEDSLQRTAGLGGFAPLLNVVLGTDIPENDTTRAMSRDARREQTAALMVHLLGEVAASGPLLIAMEDCHWLDDASWDLLEQVTDELDRLTLLLTNRPFVRRPPHSFYERLVEDLEATVVRLERIDATAARLLAADRLDAETLPDAVVQLIETKAEGHPLFIEELVYSLRDQGYLQVEGGAGVLAVAPDLLDQLDLPDSIQGLTAGRLGRLSPIEQSTVKVASVLTGGFDAELLTEIHPLHLDRDVIARQLEDLVRLDLVRGDAGGYRFRHTIMKDSAYQQLPVTVRTRATRGSRRAVGEARGRSEWLRRSGPPLGGGRQAPSRSRILGSGWSRGICCRRGRRCRRLLPEGTHLEHRIRVRWRGGGLTGNPVALADGAGRGLHRPGSARRGGGAVPRRPGRTAPSHSLRAGGNGVHDSQGGVRTGRPSDQKPYLQGGRAGTDPTGGIHLLGAGRGLLLPGGDTEVGRGQPARHQPGGAFRGPGDGGSGLCGDGKSGGHVPAASPGPPLLPAGTGRP